MKHADHDAANSDATQRILAAPERYDGETARTEETAIMRLVERPHADLETSRQRGNLTAMGAVLGSVETYGGRESGFVQCGWRAVHHGENQRRAECHGLVVFAIT